MLSTGSMIPGRTSGGYSWLNETTQAASPTRLQSAAMADTKGAAQEAMVMALPESMLVNAKHAVEEEWARRPGLDKLYILKGGFQNMMGNAMGLPPRAVSGNIMLVPTNSGLTVPELEQLAGAIGGTMNSEATRRARLMQLGVVSVGGTAYYVYQASKDEE